MFLKINLQAVHVQHAIGMVIYAINDFCCFISMKPEVLSFMSLCENQKVETRLKMKDLPMMDPDGIPN
jgi:hypothetical protein